MSMLHQSILKGSLTIMLACCFSGCDRKEEVVERSLGLEAFIPQYNRYIKDWLATEKAGFEKIIEESEQALPLLRRRRGRVLKTRLMKPREPRVELNTGRPWETILQSSKSLICPPA